VDARWLIRSLQYHYREMFSHPADPASALSAVGADGGPASPADYLDKIFQIPYALAPPPPAGLAFYLRSLLPLPASPAAAPEQIPAGGTEPPGDAAGPHSEPPLTDAHPTDRRDTFRVGTTATGPAIAIPDLRPAGLQLTRPEVEFMTRLGPLLPTPRAAKRLVNLYRLVRIRIPEPELPSFVGSGSHGPYQAVQILLALLVGSPAAAQRIFQRLMDSSPGSDLFTVLADLAAATDSAEHLEYARLSSQLATIAEGTALLTGVWEYQHWCPQLARHSFHTRTVTSQAPSTGVGHTADRKHVPAKDQLAMPFYLVLDVSSSMYPEMSALNHGIKRLRRAIVAEPVVDDVAQICIMTFSDEPKIVVPMGRMSESEVPPLTAENGTNYGAVFRAVARAVERDCAKLREQGYGIYRPCVFFVTDGQPDDDDWHQTFTRTLTYDRQTGKGMKAHPIFVPFGFRDAPEDVLKQLAYPPDRGRWYHTKSTSFDEVLNMILGIIMMTIVSSGRSMPPGQSASARQEPEPGSAIVHDNSEYDPDYVL